ncbi:MAG: RagB/SusD family nutrient uptake outer membrane protein [Bacteroidales bacterium]|nr:MAG: RagB/SusD family nutrient uptake outer membrane protein [Bacteroidales bacterium]
MVDAGYIVIAAERKFDASRDYLWPVPADDRLINDKLDQNPNW